MRRLHGGRSRIERAFAALEICALGVWIGSLVSFAFIFAPAAFHIVTDLPKFAALTSSNLSVLGILGYVCGGLAFIAAIARSRDAGDRRSDFARAALVVIAIGLSIYEAVAIVPVMTARTDLTSPAYAALHRASSSVYGGVVVLALAALILAAIRNEE